jgi:hypothetical protein
VLFSQTGIIVTQLAGKVKSGAATNFFMGRPPRRRQNNVSRRIATHRAGFA